VESAAEAGLTLHPDPATVLLDNTASDIQAEAHTGKPAIVNVSRAMEAFEHERLILDGYSDALVTYAHARLPLLPPDIHVDNCARLLTVLQGILDQIGDDL
jgi:hypothetical protein